MSCDVGTEVSPCAATQTPRFPSSTAPSSRRVMMSMKVNTVAHKHTTWATLDCHGTSAFNQAPTSPFGVYYITTQPTHWGRVTTLYMFHVPFYRSAIHPWQLSSQTAHFTHVPVDSVHVYVQTPTPHDAFTDSTVTIKTSPSWILFSGVLDSWYWHMDTSQSHRHENNWHKMGLFLPQHVIWIISLGRIPLMQH